jgi:hypothetical protein
LSGFERCSTERLKPAGADRFTRRLDLGRSDRGRPDPPTRAHARRAFSGSGPVEGAPRSRRGRPSARTSPAPAPTRGLCSPRRGQDPKSHLGGSTRWASSETITSVIPSSNARQIQASLWLHFRVACVLSALAGAVEKPGRPRLRLNPSTASSETVLCDVVSESVSTIVRSVR